MIRKQADIFAGMKPTAVIFDMDGLLIDSEPLWNQAATEVFAAYNISLSPAQYALTKGTRTKEFVEYWFTHYQVNFQQAPVAEQQIIERVIELVKQKGRPMPGVAHVMQFFAERNFKMGLATSSGEALIDFVVTHLGISGYLQAISSAEMLDYGKPHPQVYIDCAQKLGVSPAECICFEDSFNGMIAVKAARMKCVVVPAAHENQLPAWQIADLKISSLQNFNELLLQTLY